MSGAVTAAAIVDELRTLPGLPALAERVRAAAFAAAELRDRGFLSERAPLAPGGESAAGDESTAAANDPATRVERALSRGSADEGDRALIGAALALALRFLDRPVNLTEAGQLVWLATHTPCNALEALDVALETQANAVWTVVADVVRAPHAAAPDFARAEALVGAAALRASHSERARELAVELAQDCPDRALRLLLLGPKRREYAAALTGELLPTPRSPLVTALLTFTLILPLIEVVRLVGRYAFVYRRPARVRLSPRGLELEYRTEMLGRVLKDQAILVPLQNLARVTREVRYSRAGLYAGLAALVAGTYFGMGLFVDGIRVPGGSKPLLGLAFLMMFAGLAIDYGLSYLSEGIRGRCRLVVVPRTGKALCIGELDPNRADAMLSTVADHTQA